VPTANGQDKFATYYRDLNGMDYADQRYYSSQAGRFLSPDPYRSSASLANPQTWNRYPYVENDPVNKVDPPGLDAWGADSLMHPGDLGGGGWGGPWGIDVWGLLPWELMPIPGIGMAGSLPFRSVTPEERKRYEERLLTALAAAWAAGSSEEQEGNAYPKYLKVVGDTYTCFGRVVQRNVTYDLYDSNDRRLPSGQVTEHLFPIDSDEPIITRPGINTSTRVYSDGRFEDEISVQFGAPRSYLQNFTVRGASLGLTGFLDVPVYVQGFGGEYGILKISKTYDYVEINGNSGTPKKCN
jgi:RHS repeat-associated protein